MVLCQNKLDQVHFLVDQKNFLEGAKCSELSVFVSLPQ